MRAYCQQIGAGRRSVNAGVCRALASRLAALTARRKARHNRFDRTLLQDMPGLFSLGAFAACYCGGCATGSTFPTLELAPGRILNPGNLPTASMVNGGRKFRRLIDLIREFSGF
jgi:hypothetical protein